ncbi:MAG: UDP-glucose 4-epimerase [Deltaproteobacteria bacterium RIFCSPLOWO2_12_FULL_43_16]|nr:MAG: UDP-glucose 4-epimerase [Deltaproteobacteria bacterium GWA2_43_19]OGQ09434.1 MAG: UDP-glucose 4-epimerase [Deltaproteobacteria bacterium RIFCSPHIGHO2_02_FULL_43_33]OGQ33573.1 MAG: UDP-glucose 4-epimerase [Deltaproteobacteria bacterium RIFCSPLOWO2_01_FULL_42_9]OGQ58072.1 MAG: UDP-glucose 4-epimerase [Deltaproteobacteria bacterium RIFCSPLOWO2_12_FULL_43_16]HBR17451.1 UDP-glucose 4-epimerase [Deltaproteobacteria bacterium]
MRILVTGGAGFIGSHIVDAYLQEGHEVSIIDDLSSGKQENINPQAKFFKIDVGATEVEDIFKQGRFDVVNHHAAQMDVRKSVADPIFDARVNILGSLKLLQNCVKYKVKKFIFASTGGAIYGEQEKFPAPESHPTKPLSPYGVSKLAGEHYLFFYKMTYNMSSIILRYANVYGPRQDPHGEAGVVAIFAQKLLRGEQPVINGDGMQSRDFIYVGDVVRANVLALSCNGGGVFNIGSSRETTIKQLFKELADIAVVKFQEKYGPPKNGEQRRSVIDFKHAQKVLGWSPQVSLEEGLGKTVDYFKSNR